MTVRGSAVWLLLAWNWYKYYQAPIHKGWQCHDANGRGRLCRRRQDGRAADPFSPRLVITGRRQRETVSQEADGGSACSPPHHSDRTRGCFLYRLHPKTRCKTRGNQRRSKQAPGLANLEKGGGGGRRAFGGEEREGEGKDGKLDHLILPFCGCLRQQGVPV